MLIKIRLNIWALTICQPGWIGNSAAAHGMRKCCQTERCFGQTDPALLQGLTARLTRALLVRQNERVTFVERLIRPASSCKWYERPCSFPESANISPSLLREPSLIIGDTPAVAHNKPNCYFSCSFLAWTILFPNLSGTIVDCYDDLSSNSCMNDTFHFSNSVSRIPVRFLHMNQSRDLIKHNL